MGPRTGFTLIELLIVLVVIGLLAALAIPKFQETKRVAQLADMKAALRKTALDMELHFAEAGSYSTSITSSCPSDMNCTRSLPDEEERTGVSVTVDIADAIGWRARAIHGSIRGAECWIGGGAYVPRGQEEGVPGGPNCK